MAGIIDVPAIRQMSWTSVVTYGVGDIINYNLSIGARGTNLERCWEAHPNFHALPTFSSVPVINAMGAVTRDMPKFLPGFKNVYHVHGEHYTELRMPFPRTATLKSTARVVDVVNRRTGVTVCVGITTIDDASGAEICYSEWTSFIMRIPGDGAPTKGADRGMRTASFPIPARQPDATAEHQTTPEQAAAYRAATGEWNPMHIDPAHGRAGGFPGPILSGTCTIGIGVTHVIDTFAGGDHTRFQSVKLRLSKPVFPGQTVRTEMWAEDKGQLIIYRQVADDGRVVISQAAVHLSPATKEKL
jgi:acyl dehydratase